MKYVSTRGGEQRITSAEAIKKGIADNGGLFLPDHFPALTGSELEMLGKMPYYKRAAYILSLFCDDYDKELLEKDCMEAYGENAFPGGAAPVTKLGEGRFILELYHGPTCAFKDMALQIMPRLLSRALKMTGEEKTAYILVATSGDTGKAALEGYRDVEGVKIKVFYPVHGVSDIQKLQMSTQEGKNVSVQAIEGNFDDAQNGVKKIFADRGLNKKLYDAGYILTSANSINWGRLAPQIVYYISAYLDLLNEGELKPGEKVTFCVPTGNFGNIFAGYIAMRMGLPVKRFICASNKNKVLTDFFSEGVYNKNRTFYQTSSPSMDILISSNLERLLYTVCGEEKVCRFMNSLSNEGEYRVDAEDLKKLQSVFSAAYTDEEMTAARIKTTWEKTGRLIDTHTAVAVDAAERLAERGEKIITLSTASPYKFSSDVLKSLGEDVKGGRGVLSPLYELSEFTNTEIPAPLAALADKKVRFTGATDKEKMPEALFEE